MQELGIGVVSGLKKNKLQIITGGDDIHPIPTDETSRINKLLSKPIPNLSYTYINYSLHLNELSAPFLPFFDTQQRILIQCFFSLLLLLEGPKVKKQKQKLSHVTKFQVELVSKDFFSEMPKTLKDGSYMVHGF